MRKRALAGAFILTLALGASAAPVAVADGGPERPTVSLWAGIQAWLQDLVVDWFGPKGMEATYQAGTQDPAQPPNGPGCQDGGPGGPSTTDSGHTEDPDG